MAAGGGGASAAAAAAAAVATTTAAVLERLEVEQPAGVGATGAPGALVLLLHGALVAGGGAESFRCVEVQDANVVVSDGDGGGAGKEGGAKPVVAVEGWDASPDAFSFVYAHARSSQRLTLKALPLAGKLLVHTASSDADGGGAAVHSVEFTLADEVDAAALPTAATSEGKTTPVVVAWKTAVFRRPDDAARRFIAGAVAPLVGGDLAAGLLPAAGGGGASAAAPTTTTTTTTTVAARDEQQQQQPPASPLAGDPLMVGGPMVPGGGGGVGFGRGVGGDYDLDPFAGAPFGPDGGFHGPPAGGPFGGGFGGGTHVGPGHPGFAGPFPGRGAGRGRGRGGPVPGARFDPIGPYGGDPDADHLPAPHGPGAPHGDFGGPPSYFG